ncbi:hypothetical protein K8354_05200 [Polaribacter litorisediminis]|uniref:hypothetical protein n=1 Tax=Polaribacter litorisediminis TaxID=1908341 RepID=UPI001CBB77E2|nr:hypothetical protein [Polaribacter litorisediminis]UAM99221.1 hypothetical protein K8354_05200 [Polaribacter litorisediminis]
MLSKIDIQNKLERQREKTFSAEVLLASFKKILENDEVQRAETLTKLNASSNEVVNNFNIDKIDSSAIFHISQIKSICANYRLRFLSSKHFKEQYPAEAISKIHEVEKIHDTTLGGFKIIAPLEAFKLKKADDPLLFAPMGNGYYYLIHKWGTDLHPLRKLKYWSFKNVENLLVVLTIMSIVFTALTHPFFLPKEPSFGYLLMLFMFYFKGVVAMFFMFFGGSGKNFSEYSWQSQYDKIS